MCLKDTESITGHPVGSKSQLNVSGKKKTQAKAKKKLPAENISDQNGLDSDSGVSITDGSNKHSIANSACSQKKKSSKTAKLVGQVEQTAEEFEDSVVTEESGANRQENSAATKRDAMKKRQNVQQEKLVNQVKLDQEKPVNQVSDCEDKEEGGAIMKSGVVNGNGGKRNVAKSVRIASEEGRSENDDADEEEETCTEEDEQRPRQENERRAERKQRTKLVKKVRVRPS